MGKNYAMSDVHGCWEPFIKAMSYLAPDDTLYYLGDCTDRGKNGVMIFEILASDSRVHMIKGNHDEMMANAIPFVWEEIEDPSIYNGNEHAVRLWYHNGGYETAKAFRNMTKEGVYKIKNTIDKMPTILHYLSPAGHKVIMEHAGYTPFDIQHRSHDPLWDREHFHDRWCSGVCASEEVRDTYLVHGHTPVQYLKFEYGYYGDHILTKEEREQKKEWRNWESPADKLSWKPEIICYCDGHKFDIDMCTIVSNRVALLDLDTFEKKYFDGE